MSRKSKSIITGLFYYTLFAFSVLAAVVAFILAGTYFGNLGDEKAGFAMIINFILLIAAVALIIFVLVCVFRKKRLFVCGILCFSLMMTGILSIVLSVAGVDLNKLSLDLAAMSASTPGPEAVTSILITAVPLLLAVIIFVLSIDIVILYFIGNYIASLNGASAIGAVDEKEKILIEEIEILKSEVKLEKLKREIEDLKKQLSN